MMHSSLPQVIRVSAGPDGAVDQADSEIDARALIRLQIEYALHVFGELALTSPSSHISKAIVPTFYKFLQAQEKEAQEAGSKQYTEALEKLINLFENAKEEGLLFGLYGGKHSLSMAEVLVAPWVHRSRVVLSHYRNFEEPAGKYREWANALLSHPAVKATISDDELYLDSYARYAENRPKSVCILSIRPG